jgi:hypothetical protein
MSLFMPLLLALGAVALVLLVIAVLPAAVTVLYGATGDRDPADEQY